MKKPSSTSLTEEVFLKTIKELRDSLASKKDMENVQTDVVIVRTETKEIKEKTEELEEKTAQLSNRMATGFDKVMKRLDDIDTNLTLNMHDTEGLKVRVATLEHRKN